MSTDWVGDCFPEDEGDAPVESVEEFRSNGAGAQAPKLTFPLVAFKDIRRDTERRGYLVKGLLPDSGLAVIWGPPKCGKSFWTMDIAFHVALGWEYRGRRVQQVTVRRGRHGQLPQIPGTLQVVAQPLARSFAAGSLPGRTYSRATRSGRSLPTSVSAQYLLDQTYQRGSDDC